MSTVFLPYMDWHIHKLQNTSYPWKWHCGIAFKATHSTEAVVQRCSVKNVFLKISQNSQGNTCKFSCEFSEIFQNTFFYRALRVATSELRADDYRRFDCHSRPYLRVWQLDISAMSCKIVTSLFRYITISKSNWNKELFKHGMTSLKNLEKI